jgi:hypothetical protein
MLEPYQRNAMAKLLPWIARECLPEDVKEKQGERPKGNVGWDVAANLHLLFYAEAIFHTPSVSVAIVAQTGEIVR